MGTNLITFSVIIVAHNEVAKIARCLTSIYQHIGSRNDIEVILVNDGSTDETLNVVSQFPIHAINLPHCHGISYSRNLAVANSKGYYILFLDAHVYLKSPNIFNQLERQFIRNPNVVAISGSYQSKNINDYNCIRDLIREVYRHKRDEIILVNFHHFTTFSSCIGAIRREVFNAYQFPEEYKDGANEDSLFQFILMNAGKNFLHDPHISCWHDASLNFASLLRKTVYQAKGFNNLLYSISDLKLSNIPYSPFLFDYPLSIFLIPILAIILLFNPPFQIHLIGISIFLILFLIDFHQIIRIFTNQTSYPIRTQILTCIYIIINETMKIVYLPQYLLKKHFNYRQVVYIISLFLKWEFAKFQSLVK